MRIRPYNFRSKLATIAAISCAGYALCARHEIHKLTSQEYFNTIGDRPMVELKKTGENIPIIPSKEGYILGTEQQNLRWLCYRRKMDFDRCIEDLEARLK